MIDLHVHTTASDGRSSPEQVVEAAKKAGVRTLAVADHDTVSGLDRAAAACAREGITWVPGVEITATRDGADVHVLGYFIDHREGAMIAFLEQQAIDRVRRVREMAAKLGRLGVVVDLDALLVTSGRPAGGWAGRPLLARALVRQRVVRSTHEAFERYLAEGAAAWVPRRAPSPAEVIAIVHRAGGIASLAHPGLLGRDEWIAPMAEAGLDAIEAYYADHSAQLTTHYRVLAGRLGLGMSGGSDYHGDPGYGSARPGSASLPEEAFRDLVRRLDRRRHAAEGRRP